MCRRSHDRDENRKERARDSRVLLIPHWLPHEA
jgi:hypothetical protein